MCGRIRLGGRGTIVGAALIALSLTTSLGASGSKSPVSVGRITTSKPDVQSELESAVKSELGRVDLSSVRASDRYVLSAALVKLKTVTGSDQVETSCVVSATLTREKSGALHAVLEGRARATDGKQAQKDAELAALRAAVRSAIKRVPEAIR